LPSLPTAASTPGAPIREASWAASPWARTPPPRAPIWRP